MNLNDDEVFNEFSDQTSTSAVPVILPLSARHLPARHFRLSVTRLSVCQKLGCVVISSNKKWHHRDDDY